MTRDAIELSSILRRHKMNQAHLARLFGVTPAAISLIVNGKRRMSPQFRQMLRFWRRLSEEAQRDFIHITR